MSDEFPKPSGDCITDRIRQNRAQARAESSLSASNCSAFERARLNDVTVARMLKEGAGPEAIIGQLATDKEQYIKRIMELESIAPRKIVLPDGRVMLWQCPLELVPTMNTPNEKLSDREN